LPSPVLDFMFPPEDRAAKSRRLTLSAMNAVPEWLAAQSKHEVRAMSMEPYRGRSEALAHTLRNSKEHEFSFVFTTDQPTRAKAVLGQVDIFPDEDASGTGVSPVGPMPVSGMDKPAKNK